LLGRFWFLISCIVSAVLEVLQLLNYGSPLMRDYLRRRYGSDLTPRHIWCGVSVEDNKATARIRHLQDAPITTRFLSIEPLLGPVGDIDIEGVSWVIVGGESGPGARPMDADWVREIRDNCLSSEVPFFFKQWGGVFKKRTGRILDGRTWDQMPQPMSA
ncbi:MAG: DUF5131 family protein, partial [Dehalococcoidia bacterium]|nr:DUF5131 family protein [Dehalococcoidia bacterium]